MNKKVALLLSISCFTVILAISVYAFIKFRGIYHLGNIGLGKEKIERNVNFNNKDNFSYVTFAWDDMPNATSYNLYWSEKPGVTKNNGTKISNVKNPHKVTGLKKGKKYYFVVTAVNASGESKESVEISLIAGQ